MPDDMQSTAFHICYSAALAGEPVPDYRFMLTTPIEERRTRSVATINGAFRSARTRARVKGVPFDLDRPFLLSMAEDQRFRCALTGIEFFAANVRASRVDPYTPSIDRIIPSLGYTKGNVRLVIYAANAMLLDWGEELFVRVANSYRTWERTNKGRSVPAPNNELPRTLKIDYRDQ